MKKFLSGFFLIVLLVSIGLFYGCGERYEGLTFSMGFSYNKKDSSTTTLLSDGITYRVVGENGTFDDHMDGSYTFYIHDGEEATANFEVKFNGAPDDFNYGVSFSLSNEILKIANATTYTKNGIKKEITAYERGSTVLTAYSTETGKSSSVIINVVKVASSIEFANKNLAITSSLYSKLNLKEDANLVLTPKKSSTTKITYKVGYLDNENFVEYTSTELLSKGINFNKSSSVLEVVKENLGFENFYIQATYENPLDGEDLVATTQVKVVKPIYDFVSFVGESKEDAIDANLIDLNDVQELIINIEGLNYVDLVLRVTSQGEKVNFSYVSNSALPVYFLPNRSYYEYVDEDGYILTWADAWKDAKYTYYYVRAIADKKTTENDIYESGIYKLNFTCKYVDYLVDGYPIVNTVNIKNDTLIKNFSVNGVSLDNESIIEKPSMQGFYDEEVYINNDAKALGTALKVDVGNPVAISAQNAKFKVSFYTSDFRKIENVSNFFKVQKTVGSSKEFVNINDNFASSFDKNTTFYIKPNTESGEVELNQVYYMILTAEKPVGHTDKQAVASIRLKIVQGISTFTSYDYSFNRYEVDEETGLYKTDADGNKQEVLVSQNGVTFNEVFVGNETINLDLESNFDALVTLAYLPDGADLNNITIVSNDDRIIKVTRDLSDLNKFYITPISIGESSVSISTTNLEKVYVINVNVYRPITNFTVNLTSTTSSYGVGGYSLTADGKNIRAAEVKVEKQISLALSTLPSTASQYSLSYAVYKENVLEENLVGSYSIDYNGIPSSNIPLIANSEFQFDCSRNSFVFIKDESVGKPYIVVLKLTNLDGSYWEHEIILTSYVPVESIDTEFTRNSIFNPNTIAYALKTKDANDPTAFGIKIETNKKSKRVATYNFANYGKIIVIVNGVNENIFTVSGGILSQSNSNSIINMISPVADDGYYWFKLNENYDFKTLNSLVYLSIQIREINSDFLKPVSLRVFDADSVSKLRADSEEQIYFKQGLTPDKNIKIKVSEDNSFDKTLLVKSYDIVNYGGVDYYYENVGDFAYLKNVEISETNNKTEYVLNISPNLAGKSVIVVMPQDKLITLSQHNCWYEKHFVPVNISEQDFIENNFYFYELEEYVLAETYEDGKQYYIYTSILDEAISVWKNFLTFYVTVADGIKIPYQISSQDDLLELEENSSSVEKKYVLTKDIIIDSTTNWKPLGNFYRVENITVNNFYVGKYYTYNEGVYTLEAGFTDGAEYYAYGFNGELSGKYSYVNVKTGKEISYYHKITNITFAGFIEENCHGFGLFAETGIKSKVTDLEVNYNFFQPNIRDGEEYNLTFGGISAYNHGEIVNSIVKYQNFTIATSNDLTFGGVVGVNNGEVRNENPSSTGISGVININLNANSETEAKELEIFVGGFVGSNKGIVVGSYDTSKEIEYTFNNAGFDSSLNFNIEDHTNSDFQYEKAAIGGAVGENYGAVKYVSIQGKIYAVNCDNVGGLIGHTYYNKDYNGERKEEIEIEGQDPEIIEYTLYSVESSYSIAIIEGRNKVGGAIGYAGSSSSEDDDIYIYNISAENYVTSLNADRTFVKGYNNVGGLIGVATKVRIFYSYTVSYFDCSMVTNTEYPDKCYDIVSLNNAAAFICQANDVIIKNSSSYVNVKAVAEAGLFITAKSGVVSGTDVFAIGSVYGFSTVNSLSVTTLGTWYSICYGQGSTSCSSSSGATDVENIKNMPLTSGWAKDENINNGCPYLTIDINGTQQVLFATTPINILANVKDNNGDYTSYIKNDNGSLILYYNYDYLNQYKVEDVQKLNLVLLNSFAELEVYAKTHKTARLNISTSSPDVIAINEDGTLRILKEGKAVLTISSKLNNEYKVQITIVVKFGVNDISLYSNVALTNDLKDPGSKIEILKSKNQTLYLETLYTRNLQTENDATLKSTTDVAVRFSVVDDENLTNILDAADGNFDGSVTLTIDDIFKMNGFAWVYDGGSYTVDVPANINPVITPLKAMDSLYRTLTISYVPIIKQTFTTLSSTIVLDKFAGSFTLSIIKGATGIIFENNLDVTEEIGVEISQLETHTFTVTLFTDYELDEIVDTIDMKNIGNMLTVVKSDNVRSYKDEAQTVLESISITYTINYKDKMNAVEKDINYLFEFYAASDVNQKIVLPFTILGQDKINQVYGTIYANLTDFPQQPDKNNIIYNANVGVLSVEVYPYFSNYNKMRVYYQTSSEYPLLITQLSYNISGEAGELLTDYPNSGTVTDYYDVLMVEKSSGQDTYLLNNLGTYSYSKIYFFSLLVGSSVPDNTKFTVYVEFLNRQNTIIHTFKQDFTTIAQPSISFTFDDKLKSEDEIYYLPLNTDNEIDVTLVNYDGDITWEVTSNEYEFTSNELDVLTPKLNEEGKYIFRVLRYTSGAANDNVFNENLLGKKIRLTGYITDNQREYSFSQDILVTLFTVRDINVQNTTKGYMTLPMSTTSPLQVVLDLHYDKNLVEAADNWYSNWYALYEETADTTHILYKYLTACGYELTANFAGYFTQLTNSISKANYNYLDTSTTKTSGVWFYNAGDDSGYLQTNKDYNNSTFGVELYNDFFAVYGFQIDTNSNLSLKVNLSYTNNEGQAVKNVYANGVPNVYNYNISVTNATYETHFKMSKDFILNFVYKSDLINAIPVATAEDFINMKEGFDYRLVNDIVLTDYMPISTPISTFDGNNYKIYITNFAFDSSTEQDCVLGLFGTISEETILYNVTVYYTNKVTMVNEECVPGVAALHSELLKANTVTFGGIAGINNGTLTNCKVTGKVDLVLNVDVNSGTIADALNGGLVAQNGETGFITNSQVKNFDLNCYGETGGFVGKNSGKIISSYFDSSSVNNLSGDNTAGFVNYNAGEIHECYVQGYRKSTDNNISNTGLGIVSKGIVGGFVYTNISEISDCYANVSLSSSKYIAGFIYEDSENSVISRCYSISSKSSSDKSTVASPFAAANSAGYTKITINGLLNNCYYLNESDNPWNELTWDSSEENKQAKALSLDDFSTHTKFVNYDLSLVYNKGFYADNKTTYNYVDGYTWVIIEGKPVIVSTLIETISQRDYIGKSKNYSDASYVYYNQEEYGEDGEDIVTVQVAVGQDKVRTSYYNNELKRDVNLLTDDELLFYTIQDNTALTLTYFFVPTQEDTEAISIVYSITLKDGLIESKKLVSAEYGNEGNEKKILDTKELGVSNKDYVEDKNFRANDTLEITYNNKGVISNINYKVLESASYYYGSNAFETSHVVGSRTNPQIIYDYESFVYYTATENLGRYYRVIKDINFNYQFTPTAYATFQGSLQGNFMDFDNLSISYLNSYTDNNLESGNAFGLFATISTINSFIDDSGDVIDDSFYTIVSNLRLNVIEVLSNSHNYVGALAGQLKANYPSSNKMVIINNVSVKGINGRAAYIQGKNAVGGLVGAAYGNVIIKDIDCAVNVNATKEMSYGDVQKILYSKDNPISNIAYAGGVIGIFDGNKVDDPSTQKNYNANNISISGEISITGGVVGSAFGLVGPSTVVNYVNTVVSSSSKTYLKATSYAGGLVGENRGEIISSSVTYGTAETYSSVKPGISTFTEYNYFYNGYTSDNPIAIGGLVGLNNGGRISHSITTVDVRNKKAEVAGGAIGRMIQGKVDHVISSGSVVGKTIIGGFVGTINDRDILTNAGYNDSAITNPYDGKTVKSIITNCVSATNWLISDYTYYRSVLNAGNPVAGFIGLIAYSSMEEDIGFVGFTDGVDSGNTYYSNALYTSSNSEYPQKYLKATYQSEALDLLTQIVEGAVDVLYDGEGKQIVYPYSAKEFYYEDTFKNSNYQIKTETRTSNSIPDGMGPILRTAYIVEFFNNIENIGDLYSRAIPDPDNDEWADDIPEEAKTFDWYILHFAKIYLKEGNEFKEIKNETEFNNLSASEKNKIYYIPNPILNNFTLTKRYTFDGINDIVLGLSGALSAGRLDDHTFSILDDFEKIKSFTINGIEIFNINKTRSNSDSTDDYGRKQRLYTCKNINVTLPNGSVVNEVKYYIIPKVIEMTNAEGEIEQIVYYTIDYIDITYIYDTTASKFINNVNTSVSRSQQLYNLSVDSKAVIYDKYLQSSYWKAASNFLLDASLPDVSYEKIDKYLINLELADIYLWSTFLAKEEDLTKSADGFYEIETAEELALFANLVNTNKKIPGSSTEYYATQKVRIIKDIDLSGKYWVPIGTGINPFRGTFSGLYSTTIVDEGVETTTYHSHIIKYATVNENSNQEAGRAFIRTAGLFGFVTGATISDLIITGGDMVGEVAGGVVASSTGTTTITNVINRNNVFGVKTAGGIVGEATSTLKLSNVNNYGEISHNNSSTGIGGFGGLVGNAVTLNIKNSENNGGITVFNNKTSYSGSGSKLSINVGGLVGDVTSLSFVGENFNEGNISIKSNAHTLSVGGIVGLSRANTRVISNLKNYGNINVNYNNIYSVAGKKVYAVAAIGGIAGYLRNNLTLSGNEGKIYFTINTTSNSYIGIGGIAGILEADNTATTGVKGITQSYNTNNIEISSISNKTHIAFGGIAGYVDATSTTTFVQDCYNSGDLLSDSNATSFAGGIVGATIVKFVEDGAREFLYTQEEPVGTLAVQNTLNIGYVNVTNINTNYNALGAIVGASDTESATNGLLRLVNGHNYYLRDSAYSGTKIYPGYSVMTKENVGSGGSSEKYTYEPVVTENEVGCDSNLVTTLKTVDTYDGWDFSASGIWEQSYDTWFPSIKNNLSSSMWDDKQEDLSQEKGSYIVSSAEQLAFLSAKINSGEIESTNITIKLTDFVDLSNRYWTPIGTKENPFKGNFDGSGYVIRNLTIDGDVLDDADYGGLFGYVEDAKIENLGLESVIIKNVDYAAAIAYSAKNSKISKVYSDKSNSDDSIVSAKYASGGLICLAEDCNILESNNFTGGLYYSYNNVPVEITETYSNSLSFVGGLVARLRNSLIDSSYNNKDGIVKTSEIIEDEATGTNNSIVIAGYADRDSSLFNVFNLSQQVKSEGASKTTYNCTPLLYRLEVQEGKMEAAINSTIEPSFENLATKDGFNNKDIWTEEYTLNEKINNKYYPSIRGLGQEWKNTESEALISISYNEIDTRINATLEKLEEKGIPKTLVNRYTDDSELNVHNKIFYLVTSEEELAWIATNVNSGNLLTTNSEFILLKDLDLSKRYWTPIGSSSVYPFQGVFNFNGHTIKGLTIDSSNLTYGGLFGYTDGATIVDGYLIDTFIKLKSEDPMTNIYVGSLVGKGWNTTILNFGVTTAIAGFSNSGVFVGGVIGSLAGTQDYLISNVRVEKAPRDADSYRYSYIDISSYYHQVVEITNEAGEEIGKIRSKTTNIGAFSSGGNVYAGGVVGYISGYELQEVKNEYLIDAAYNDCNVTAVSTSNAASTYLGGVVGFALEQVSLNNIKNIGNLKSFTYQYDTIGGVVGYMSNGNIQNAFFGEPEVKPDLDEEYGYLEPCQDFNNHIVSYVGGIIGVMQAEGFIKQCVSTGKINDNPNYATNASIGGIIGVSKDRRFNSDESCIFSTENNFNYNAIGYDEQLEKDLSYIEDPVEKEAYQTSYDDLIKSLFTNDFSNINSNNKFDGVLWSDNELNSVMTYICGCGTTFVVDKVDGIDILNVTLSSGGKLAVNLSTAILQYGTGDFTPGDKMGIALTDDNYNYIYREVDLTGDVSNINLKTQIDKAFSGIKLLSKPILCCVTLINVKAGS